MNEEIWKDIPNYIGMYKVSNLGRVISFKCAKPRILKVSLNNDGYPRVNLFKNDKPTQFRTHKIMQSVFNMGIGYIDHIDGCRTNNSITNLRVVTQRQNNQNMPCHRNGHLVGTTRSKGGGSKKPWSSSIMTRGKSKHLGMFATNVEAHERYMQEYRLLDE